MDIKTVRERFPQYNHVSDEQLLKAIHQRYYSQVPYEKFASVFKPETTVGEDIKIGTAGALSRLDAAQAMARVGYEQAISQAATTNPLAAMAALTQKGVNKIIGQQTADDIFKRQAEREAALNKWANPEQKQQSFGGELLGTAATLPLQIPAIVGASPQKMQDLIQKGESVQTAQQAGLIDTALNTAMIAAPAAFGKTLTQKVLTGAGANTVFGGVSDAATRAIAEQEATKKAYDPFDPRRRAMDAIIGGGVGAVAPKSKPTAKPKTPPADEVLNNLTKAREPEPDPNLEFYKAEAERRVRELREQPIYVDQAGVASRELPTREPAQPPLFDQPEMGRVANPYEAALGDWRVDENGIPVKVDLSMEAQNLQDPLQRNLFGIEGFENVPQRADELPPKMSPVGQSATLFDENGMQMAPRNLTEAIDIMDPAAREEAIRQRMMGPIESGELSAAVQAANMRPLTAETANPSLYPPGGPQIGMRPPVAKTKAPSSLKDATANLMDAIASATGAKQNFLKDGGVRTAAKDFVNALWDAGSRKWSEVLAKGRELFGDTWRKIGQVVKAEWDSFVRYQKAISAGQAGSFATSPFKKGDKIITKEGVRGTIVDLRIIPKRDLSGWYAKRQELHDQAFQGYMAGQHTFDQATAIFDSLVKKNEDVLRRLFRNDSNEVEVFPKVLLEGQTRPKTLSSDDIETHFGGPKPFVPKGQRGALDIAQIKEGFKPLYRALSRLTDQEWVKQKFPASEYQTNPDGTPLIMLHGTSKQYDKINVSPEGIHLGFVVPSHLIFTTPGGNPASIGLQPKSWSKATEYPTEPTKLYRNFAKDNITRIRGGANIRPYTIKKGNYPELPFDFGSWDPRMVIPGFYVKSGQRFIDYLVQSAQEKNLPTSKNRFDFLLNRAQSTFGYDSKERASAFNQALKEAGIDGFFYKNKHETLNVADDRYASAAHAKSFVTWNPNNVKNVYEGGPSNFIPKGQRGSVDPDLLGITKALNTMGMAKKKISEAIDAAFGSLKFPKSEDQQKADSFKAIPGMKDEPVISKDPVFENEKPKILAEGKDGSSVWWAIPGRVAAQEIRNSALIKSVGRLFENARNRAEYAIRNSVMPLKEAIQIVSRSDNDVVLLHKIFMQEAKQGSKFTPEELTAAGVSPELLKAYTQLRENYDTVLSRQNQARMDSNLPPIKGLDAYFASRFVGPWTAEVRDASGKLLYFIREPSKRGLKQAMGWIKEGFPDLKVIDLGYDKSHSFKKDRIDEGYQAMLDILGPNDPLIQQIDAWRKQRASETTENVLGQERHFKQKTGVEGFAGGRPWKDAAEDARDFLRQQLQYIENGYRWAENQAALRETKKYLSDPEIKAQQPNNLEYVRELAKLELGIGTKEVFDKIENAVAKGLKGSPGHLQMTLGMSKAFFYLWNLGLSLPYMTISILQPAQVLPAALLSSKASFVDAAKALQDGPYVFVRQLVDDYNYKDSRVTGLIAHVKGKEGAFLEEAYRYARDNRVTEVNQLSDIRDPANTMGIPSGMELANKTVGLSISLPEIAARSFSYMSFVNGLKHKYDINTKEGRMALFEEAAEKTKSAMGDYNAEQKAPIFQRMGMMGNALSTLQTFIFNQMFQLAKYSKQAAKGDPMPLVAYLGMSFAMAGATGMIAVDDVQELMNTIKRLLPPSVYKEVEKSPLLSDPKAWLVKNTPDYISHGLVSSVTGTNLYTRFSMGDVINAGPFESDSSTIVESLLPFVADIYKKGMAGVDLASGVIKGDAKKMKEAGYVLTPSGLRGMYEETVPGFRQGQMIMQPRDIKKAQVSRPEEEKGLRMAGFRSLREQKELDMSFSNQTAISIRNEQLKEAGDKLQNALFNQKGIADAFSTWVELGGNPANINPMMKRYILDQAYPELYQQAMKARSSSPAERMKAQRAIEIVNELQR